MNRRYWAPPAKAPESKRSVSLEVLKSKDVLPQDLWLTNDGKIDAAIQSAMGSRGEALRLHGEPEGSDHIPPTPDPQDHRRPRR